MIPALTRATNPAPTLAPDDGGPRASAVIRCLPERPQTADARPPANPPIGQRPQGSSLARLVAQGERRSYRRGTILINEGDQGDALFIVVSGRVKVYSTDQRGREIVYGLYGEGATIGEMSLDGGLRSASVVTTAPTVCAMISREVLTAHIESCPAFAFELIAKVIERARLATRTARNMALLDVYGRLVELLESLASETPDGRFVISERPTHAGLANRVGCSREMITRLVRDLRLGGYLVVQADAWLLTRRSLPSRW